MKFILRVKNLKNIDNNSESLRSGERERSVEFTQVQR